MTNSWADMTASPSSEQKTTIPRLDANPSKVYRAQVRVNTELRRASSDAGLDTKIIELVCVRVSQINGCGACLSAHTQAAREAGVSEAKLDVIAAWRGLESQLSAKEYAALELAEELTLLPQGRRATDVVHKVSEHFTEDQLAALEWVIITINSFNRISIASGHPASM